MKFLTLAITIAALLLAGNAYGTSIKAPGKVYPCLALTQADLDETVDAIDHAARQLD